MERNIYQPAFVKDEWKNGMNGSIVCAENKI
jgi:hypothetical protein